MKQRPILLALIACCLVISCSRPREAVFFAEEYWWGVLDEQSGFRADVAKLVTAHDYVFTAISSPQGQSYTDNLRKVIQDETREVVITGPLLTPDVLTFAQQYPQKFFLIIPAPRLNENIPPNVALATYDRSQAFFTVGKMTGEILDGDYNAAFGEKIGIILSGTTKEEREMAAEFERGFSLSQETGAILKEEIGTTTDRVKAGRAVENLFNKGVRVFFVKTYALNPVCLDKIRNLGGFFIVEDFSYFSQFSDRLFFSIENDFLKAIGQFIRQVSEGRTGNILLTGLVIPGEVLKDYGGVF